MFEMVQYQEIGWDTARRAQKWHAADDDIPSLYHRKMETLGSSKID